MFWTDGISRGTRIELMVVSAKQHGQKVILEWLSASQKRSVEFEIKNMKPFLKGSYFSEARLCEDISNNSLICGGKLNQSSKWRKETEIFGGY